MIRLCFGGRTSSVPSFAWACLVLVPVIVLAMPSAAMAQPLFQLQPGAVGGDTYSVISYGGAGNAAPVFGANGNLISPGAGYGSLGAAVGGVQTDFGGIAAPAGPLAGGLNTVGTTPPAGNAANPFGPGFLDYSANNNGVQWTNFLQADTTVGDGNFSTSESRGIATYKVNGVLNGGQAGVVLPVEGFLPIGSQAFVSLVGTVTDTSATGVVKQKATDAVVIAVENNGTGLPNGVQNVSVPIAGGVAQGVAGNSATGYAQGFDGAGDLLFGAYGIALFNGINYAPGDTLTLDGTLTLAVDPMASLVLDFNLIPGNSILPSIGFLAEVPEPSSMVLGGVMVVVGLGYAARRRFARA